MIDRAIKRFGHGSLGGEWSAEPKTLVVESEPRE
jgi:hypothetical protein